jgi:hypothetical protein
MERKPSQFSRTVSHYIAIADMLTEAVEKFGEITFRHEKPYVVLETKCGKSIKTLACGSCLDELLNIDQDAGWR